MTQMFDSCPIDENKGSSALILEDDAGAADILAEMIEILGWQAKTVSTRKSFVEAVRTQNFDMVFLDIFLPDFDAPDAVDYMYRSGMRGPVCLISGGSDDMIEMVAKLAEAKGVDVVDRIRKPLSFDVLKNLLHRSDRIAH